MQLHLCFYMGIRDPNAGPHACTEAHANLHLKDKAWLPRKLKIQVEAQNTKVRKGNSGSQVAEKELS